jgi:5-methyltetrahydropteroyltriglutamate--homocysteine methyltransferase
VFRADQVGSLLRPTELLKARAANSPDLRAIEDRSIADVLQKQRDIGLDVVTDGEMRRASWLADMAAAVEGFGPARLILDWKGPGGGAEATNASAAVAQLRKVRKLTGHEVPFLKKFAGAPFKMTVPAPSNFMVASYAAGVTDKIYPSHADLLRDLTEIVRDEVAWLAAEGVDYIQFDAPYYSHYLDPQAREKFRANGVDPDRELTEAIEGDNLALRAGRGKGPTMALHVCRGNNRSRWYTEGGYDAIAEKLFGELEVDRFLLEYDTERSGGFEPLRLVPKGKRVVLGLITTKDAKLESIDELRRRIDEAALFLPLENLSISTQCGFASTAPGNLLTEEQQWRKLELVVEIARRVWA